MQPQQRALRYKNTKTRDAVHIIDGLLHHSIKS